MKGGLTLGRVQRSMPVMNALEPLPAADSSTRAAAFEVRHAGAAARPPTPLVFASPHSGRCYPPEMMSAAALDAVSIRRSEDAFVDDLIVAAPEHGAALITANFARAYIDLNREPFELDASMFADELPAFARGRTARVAAGLGTIARVVSEGQEIYHRKLMYAEAQDRIAGAHQPYHEALVALIAEARAAHGFAILVDWHSMPSAAARAGARDRPSDFVLGDRFGAACAAVLPTRVDAALAAMGYRVARNVPYAGGYTTEHYGRPHRGVHALQIEINRALYLDEATLEPTSGFARLKGHIETLTQVLAGTDWSGLRR